jgi:hypothetical protein
MLNCIIPESRSDLWLFMCFYVSEAAMVKICTIDLRQKLLVWRTVRKGAHFVSVFGNVNIALSLKVAATCNFSL